MLVLDCRGQIAFRDLKFDTVINHAAEGIYLRSIIASIAVEIFKYCSSSVDLNFQI